MSNVTKITLTSETTIDANGMQRTKNAKPVFCISTGEVYASATDAAEANGVSVYAISVCCLGKVRTSCGKRWCYIKDIEKHLEEISINTQERNAEASAYREIMCKKHAVENAKAEYEKHQANYDKLQQKLTAEYEALAEAKAKYEALAEEAKK